MYLVTIKYYNILKFYSENLQEFLNRSFRSARLIIFVIVIELFRR